MTYASGNQTSETVLEIAVDQGRLQVSNLSSLLRIVQAALREVAKGVDEGRQAFAQPPYPVLLMSADQQGGELVIRFFFDDPIRSQPYERLSMLTFIAFMEQFKKLYLGQPQRGLWGEAVVRSPKDEYESETARRVDEVRLELQRFTRSRLTFDRQTVRFEGDRMEMV